MLSFLKGPKFDVACTVEISHTFDSLHAHCALDNGIEIESGDEVIIHGAPVEVPYGEVQTFRRIATVQRAGHLKSLWARLKGNFEFMELCEFSFSERATL